jgi:hypothetical protein
VLAALQVYVERHPALRRPALTLPHAYVGRAANVVALVATHMGKKRREVTAATSA